VERERCSLVLLAALVSSPMAPASAAASVELYRHLSRTLSTMVGATPILTDTVRVMPTNLFVYLPIIKKN